MSQDGGWAFGDDGFRDLTEKITRESSFHCISYKERCVRRRIGVRMRARGTATYEQYSRILDVDGSEYERLIDVLTVNVTRFFRNPTAFAAIRQHVIPDLWQRRRAIRGWSAGTASGEEAFSLAALFYEYAMERDELPSMARISVVGSDIDRASLDAARLATYLPASFADTDPEAVERLFPACRGGRTVIWPVRAVTSFERRDLLTEPPGNEAFDLIACRNVLIYLDRASQERLLDTLYDCLRPGGYLALGHVETLFGKSRAHLMPVDVRERLYRKPV